MGHNYVGTEHLLLGLLIEGEGIAAHVLEDLGANLEKVRGEIERLLHESGLEEETKEAQKKPSKTPLLDQFCRDLTELALKNQLDPVIGRAMEIERVVQILSRRTKNNPALIGATTLNEYRKYIEKDAALERRFQPVFVDEPSLAETIDILHGIRSLYEKHHRVNITDDALRAAAELSVRYVSDRSLPDKAIDLIDESSARVRMKLTTTPEDLREMQREIRDLRMQKEEAIAAQDYETAANL